MPDGDAGTADRRDDWWHVVPALPAYVVVHGVLSGATGLAPDHVVLVLPLLGFLLLYPVALLGDVRYVRAASGEWQPNRLVYGLLGLVVLATVGLASFLVSPYYLYRRHRHLGTP